MTELLKELVEYIKTASPQLWAILIKQAYVEAVGHLLWTMFLMGVTYALYRVGKWSQVKKENDEFSDWEYAAIFSYLVAGITFIIGFAFLVSTTKWFINPEFYAIRYILQQLGS